MIADAKALILDVVDQRRQHDVSIAVLLDLLVLEESGFAVLELDGDADSVHRARARLRYSTARRL